MRVDDLISSDILLVGLARTGVPKRPPFEDDHRAVSEALHGMVDDGMRTFYMGHCSPLQAHAVCRHAHHLAPTFLHAAREGKPLNRAYLFIP